MREGDAAAEQELFELVYPRLREIARQRLSREARPEEQTASIVHECYMRFAQGRQPEISDRNHFFALMSRLMRQILVDHARTRFAQKRDRRLETGLDAAQGIAIQSPALLRLHEALHALAEASPLQARLIEMRFFAGMTAEESATVVDLPVAAVRRELRFAQAWLKRAMEA